MALLEKAQNENNEQKKNDSLNKIVTIMKNFADHEEEREEQTDGDEKTEEDELDPNLKNFWTFFRINESIKRNIILTSLKPSYREVNISRIDACYEQYECCIDVIEVYYFPQN